MYHQHTSGTSGTPLDLWAKRETVLSWYALAEARWSRWYGVTYRDRWAMLGGQLVAPVSQRRPPFWVWNAARRQLYMSSYHLQAEFIPAYIDALRRHRVHYLLGYTSSLYALAEGALRQSLDAPEMVVAIANAEPVYDYQREVIREAFKCPVRETYGMSEMVCAASECEQGELHLWPEVGLVEVLDGTHPVPVGQTGDLVCTGLLNADMPLIRYRLGDRGALSDKRAPCPCGRKLPILQGIEGRCDDVLYGTDGTPVGRLDPVFKKRLPIQEAQIVQDDWQHITVRYVAGGELDDGAKETVATEIRARMGQIRVDLERVDEIPREANGKFRAVVCRIPGQGDANRMAKQSNEEGASP